MNRAEYIHFVESSFGRMNADGFASWLEAFLDHRDPSPALPRTSPELLLDLVNMFETLPGRAVPSFREALDRSLDVAIVPRDQTQTDTIEKLFFLVQLANVAKPERGKRILRRLASIPHLFDIRYAEQRLHSAILNAMCRYDVDQTVVTQILNLALPERGFKYLVMCMRLLSYSMESQTTYSLLSRIVPMIQDDTRARHLERELDPIIRRLGSRDLLVSYQELKSRGELELSEAFNRFDRLMIDAILPRFTHDPKSLATDDPAAALLRLQINSDDVSLGMDDIKTIAGSAGTVAPRSAIVFLLATLRGRDAQSDPGTPCWEILDYDGYDTPTALRGKAIIYTPEKSFLLRRDSEPTQIEILLEAQALSASRSLTNADIWKMTENSERGSVAALIGSGFDEELNG